ncbi:hypothetical protein BASA50_007112 [Batrachochytrium salamandrivorans]|uniref:Uncharacterized protein n=1 Tax=Batrachochytrium salamandrivorans TaxID=1357716 RepID=A0ABQ8F853_9FUNG|nr:hypothetical protein BASA50_007112 [Batrachochytrium salamandrivorans]
MCTATPTGESTRSAMEYEEANQDTHTKCTESKKAELDFHDEAVNMNLNRSGMMTKNSYKASQRVTQHLQLPVETDPIKYVNELRKICKDAKKREADAKLKLRKYEDKNGYEKSQKHDKYQSKETMERLKAEAKQNEEA